MAGYDSFNLATFKIKMSHQAVNYSQQGFSIFQILDQNDNRVLDVNTSAARTFYNILSNGTLIGNITVRRVGGLLSGFFVYDFYDGSGKLLGTGEKVRGEPHYILKDPNNVVLALATGDVRGFGLSNNFAISKSDGSTKLASISRTANIANEGALQKMADSMSGGILTVNIQDKTFPKLMLLQFALLIEMQPGNGRGDNTNPPASQA